jgi:hypothetical protein
MSLAKQWIWPDVSLRRNAQSAIQEAFLVTLAIAAYRLMWVLIVYLRDSETGLNWGGLLDGLCFSALAVGLYFRSRTTAVISFGLYVAEFIYNSVMVRPQNPIIPALIGLALFAGIRGSFAYQKLPPKPIDLPTIEQSFRSVKPAPENPNQGEQSS